MNNRRTFCNVVGTLAAGAVLPALWGKAAVAADPARVAIAVPGPGNLLFLPIELTQKIGADRAEGIELDIRYVSGGPVAFRDMADRNTDFAAGGLAALALQRLNGHPVVCVAPTTRVPAYTLLVRHDLRTQVRKVADLAGRVVGVKGHVPGGRSTSQLFTEYVLARSGVTADKVNYVSVGQAYASQHAALASGTVDAIMGDEPFASRLVRQKVATILADYHDLATTRQLLGGLFLNGHIATREDFIAARPEVVGQVVASLRRALIWIDKHSADDMVKALNITDREERLAMAAALKANKHIYSPDGRLSTEQVDCVTRFFRHTETTPAAQAFDVASIVNPRWAGSAP